MQIKELTDQLIELVGLETNSLLELKGAKKDYFCELLCIDNPEPIFYNKTNLVLTHPDDYAALSENRLKIVVVLSLQIPEFNSYMFIGRYNNVAPIKAILHDTELD